MADVLAAASYSRIGFSPCLAVRARRVRVPGGSVFHMEPVTITVSSPSLNQEPSLVCVVVIVQILTLRSEHLVCSSRISFADYDSGVKVESKNKIRPVLLLSICLFICRFSLISKSEYNHVYVFANNLCAIVSPKINYI